MAIVFVVVWALWGIGLGGKNISFRLVGYAIMANFIIVGLLLGLEGFTAVLIFFALGGLIGTVLDIMLPPDVFF
jgi:hypothetical protein